MDVDLPETGIDVPSIDQVAFAVEDLYDGMDRFGAVLGIDGWEVYRFEPPAHENQRYRGQPVDNAHRIAVTDSPDHDLMIELMEPLYGPNLYDDFLTEHGEGMHHVASFGFDDPEGAVERFEDAGVPVYQYGKFHDVEYWYFDSEEVLNGVIFEIVKNPYGTDDPDERYG